MGKLSIIVIAICSLFGCQTVQAVANNDTLTTIPTTEEESIDEKPYGIKTVKPVLCVPSVKLLAHLKSIGESPYASWFDEGTGHPVIMLVNLESGTSTILEYPAMGNSPMPMYEGLACVISAGISLNMKPPKKVIEGKNIKF
jgi:hypothetical protein